MLLDFRCLNIWYVKTSYLIVMKLIAYTKADIRVLYINFLSDLKILMRHDNFIMEFLILFDIMKV